MRKFANSTDPQVRRKLFAGASVRRLREGAGWTQQALAKKLKVSPSYLNQIEHNQRPLTAGVLLELSRIFRVDVSTFSDSGADRLMADLQDALADPALGLAGVGLSELKAAIQHSPAVAAALVRLQATHRALMDKYQSLDTALITTGPGPTPAEASFPYDEVRDFFHRIGNYVDVLDRMGEATRNEVGGDAFTLCEALERRLEERHRVRVVYDRSVAGDPPIRRFRLHSRTLELDGFADRPSRAFALAHQVALLEAGDAIRALARDAGFRSAGAAAVCEVALANYYAGAVLLSYGEFLESARRHRHDLGLLTRLFGASVEQVAHRLSTMQRPGANGVPFYFLRVDRAGNITKRHSATRLSFARYGGACPLWNVHEAFEAPDRLHVQVAEMPDGVRYLSLAQAITKAGIGRGARRRYAIGLGCELADAGQVVYADEIAIDNDRSVTPIGVSCRLCERPDCAQRAFPPDRPLLDRRLKPTRASGVSGACRAKASAGVPGAAAVARWAVPSST